MRGKERRINRDTVTDGEQPTGLRSSRVREEFEQSVPFLLSSAIPSGVSSPSPGSMRKERTKEKPRPRALNI